MCACERGEGDLPPLEYGVEIVQCKGIECGRSCVPEELDDEGFCEECTLQNLDNDDGFASEAEEGELGPIGDPLT